MTPEQFRKTVAKGQVSPVYFFSGPEAGLMREALDAVVALVPEGMRVFNVQVFHAFETEMAEVLTAAGTLPFPGSRRVVVLRDIEKTRLDQMGRGELLAAYLAAPARETVFVVTTGDEAKAKALARQHGQSWVQVEFRALTGGALAKALHEEAGRLGVRLAEDGLATLLETTGADLARARSELAKLRAAVGAGGAVDAAAVQKYAAGYEHHGVFDVTDAVSRRDLAAALRLLHEVTIKDEEFLGLLGQIGKRLRILWYLSGGDGVIPKEFRPYSGMAARLAPDARKFTRPEIERGLEGLRRLDDRVKSADVPPRLLLEHFLIGFLAR